MSADIENQINKRIHAVVHGHVQGVTFRATATRKASALGIIGWIRNTSNGTVETVAEGSKERLDAYVRFLHEGPPAARVTNVEINWETATASFDDFRVRYTR